MKYDLRVKSCLGYFSVKDAVRILGIVACAGVCGDLASDNLLIALVRSTMVVAYIALLIKDTEYRRMMFLYAYIFNCIAQPAIFLLGAEGYEINATRAAERSC